MTTTPAVSAIPDFLSERFEIARHVTLPFYIIPEDGTPAYIKFNTKIEPDTSSFSERVNARRKKEGESEDKKPEPMNIAQITNLLSGEVMRLVSHTVLTNTMQEAYADGSYVGKMFRIVKTAKKGGRGPKYFAFDVAELREKQADNGASSAPAKSPAKR